jgi:hypothetical protein
VGVDTRAGQADVDRLRAQIARGATFEIRTSGLNASQLASITAGDETASATPTRSLKVARAELDVVSKKEGVTEVEVAEATQKVTRAQRDAELASLRLAAAQETVAAAQGPGPRGRWTSGCCARS